MVSKINDNEVGMMRLLLLWFRVRHIHWGVISNGAIKINVNAQRPSQSVIVVTFSASRQILALPIELITYSSKPTSAASARAARQATA